MTRWIVILAALFLVSGATAEAGDLCEYSKQQWIELKWAYDVAHADAMRAYKMMASFEDDKTSKGYRNWEPAFQRLATASSDANWEHDLAEEVLIKHCEEK